LKCIDYFLMSTISSNNIHLFSFLFRAKYTTFVLIKLISKYMSNPSLRSILLVDDDHISNLFNKIFISKLELDIEVDIAVNGQVALDFINGTELTKMKSSMLSPCLLLLDINMPIMNGWEFLETYESTIKNSLKNEIFIVVLTTSEEEADRVKAAGNPSVREFVQKPLSERKIKALINTYFQSMETS